MLSRLQGIIDSIQDSKAAEVFDVVRRKQRLYNSEMQIGDNLLKIKESSHLVMNDQRMFIKDIKLELADEYFQVTFDNGEFIHYDYYGQAYLSLNPKSKLYKLRLSRYDITNII
jgi:hypothetical protein